MVLSSPKKASKYFRAKMEFTTGPMELNNMIQLQERINIIDVRKPEDFRLGHIPSAINKYRHLDTSLTGLSKDRNNIIYSYSEDCHLAASAARDFAEHGYPVLELEGPGSKRNPGTKKVAKKGKNPKRESLNGRKSRKNKPLRLTAGDDTDHGTVFV